MSKTVHEYCIYWQESIGLCGITGNDYCPKKCSDYTEDDYDYEDGENE